MTVRIDNLGTPELRCYANLSDRQMRNALHSGYDAGVFVAESPKVIRMAIANGYEPLSLLCEAKHIEGDARDIALAMGDKPVYTAPRELLAELTGYVLTRGVLAAFRRPAPLQPIQVAGGRRLIAVIYDVCDATNVGAIFRSAAALGVDGVLLSQTSCDPLNRRALRVSMGTVFTIPWAFCQDPVGVLQEACYTVCAMALRDDALPLDRLAACHHDRIAVVFGTEGEGLPDEIIDRCDRSVIIPMRDGVDSLNVAAASAVTFWALTNTLPHH